MRDDELDELLGEGLRAEPPATSVEVPLDEGLLLAYRAGRLSEPEAEALERRLARDPEARALLRELSQDVSEGDIDRVVQAAPPPNVIPLFRRGRAVGLLAASLAAAAGVALLVTRPPATAPYRLEVEGGISPTRGAAAPVLALAGEARVIVRLRAEVPTSEPRAVGCYQEDAEGRLRRARCERDAREGSFEVRFTRASFEAPGAVRVWLVVQRGADAPERFEGHRQAEVVDEGLSWHALELEVRSE